MIRASLEPLSALKKIPRNPKLHDVEGLEQSYERFGFIDRIVVNDITGRMLAGHGRLEALLRAKSNDMEPPDNVEVRDGEWLVPADHVQVPAEDEEAACVALNRWVERGGWDESLLTEVLSDYSAEEEGLDGLGFGEDDLDALMAFSSFDDYEAVPDLEWEEPEKAWRVILQCDTEAEYRDLRERLGFIDGNDEAVRFEASDIVWSE